VAKASQTIAVSRVLPINAAYKIVPLLRERTRRCDAAVAAFPDTATSSYSPFLSAESANSLTRLSPDHANGALAAFSLKCPRTGSHPGLERGDMHPALHQLLSRR